MIVFYSKPTVDNKTQTYGLIISLNWIETFNIALQRYTACWISSVYIFILDLIDISM